MLDPAVFAPSSVSDETLALNREIADKLRALRDQWEYPPAEIRARRAQGQGPFPLAPKSPRARMVEIDGAAGPLALRVIAAEAPAGIYLHLHGGGWMLGAADQQDPMLEAIADGANLAVVSLEYRLAPEHPYPAAPDDCEAAALWLMAQAKAMFGSDRLLIGGESAGAHLAVVTLMRLRDRHGLTPFSGVHLNAGCFDLSLTPSARNWGPDKLVLNSRDIRMFVAHFLKDGGDLDDPDVSPLKGNLGGLPPALFMVGTRDPLLDDTLFMAARWTASGNKAELAVMPGGAHVFIAFPGALTEQAIARTTGFLASA